MLQATPLGGGPPLDRLSPRRVACGDRANGWRAVCAGRLQSPAPRRERERAGGWDTNAHVWGGHQRSRAECSRLIHEARPPHQCGNCSHTTRVGWSDWSNPAWSGCSRLPRWGEGRPWTGSRHGESPAETGRTVGGLCVQDVCSHRRRGENERGREGGTPTPTCGADTGADDRSQAVKRRARGH